MRSKRASGGRGILLGGVPGVPAAEVIILGGGVSGTHAATIALGMGANVVVVDRSAEALRRLSAQFGTGVRTIFSTRAAIEELVKRADLLIRHRAGAGRRGTQAGDKGDARHDEAWRGDRRCRDRPGRLLRGVEGDDPFQSDLCRRRHRPLLRRQHARRGGAHLHFRPQQRDLALRAGSRRQGLETGAEGRPSPARPGSTFTTARSPASRWRRRMGSPIRRRPVSWVEAEARAAFSLHPTVSPNRASKAARNARSASLIVVASPRSRSDVTP